MKKRYHILSLVVFTLLLSFLYNKSKVIENIRAENIFSTFRAIKEADSLLDENILKSRYYINKNYDPINESIQRIQTQINYLEKEENFLKKSESRELIDSLEQYKELFNEKKYLIETFKAQNSILKNALYLLPIATEKVKSLKLYNGANLDKSLKNILIFNLTGDEEIRLKCVDNLKSLKTASLKINNIEFYILLKHTENILQKKSTLDQILSELLKIKTAETLEILSEAFSMYYNSLLFKANIYRLLTYIFSVTLIIYIAYILIKLLISSISINIANSNLLSINRTFEKFVPKESISLLSKKSLGDLSLGDHVKKKMTVLFSDIRSFTTLSEKMTPEDNFKFINSYLGEMGPVIRKNNGFIDKYIGDAIMAIFEKEEDAVIAGIEMLNTLSSYNEKNRNTEERPPIKIGIGIHSGDMMFGTVGEHGRMESTVISDAVNLASRVESSTKEYGISMLITEDILLSIRSKENFKIRYIDKINVKGKNIPVKIYEIYNSDPVSILQLKDRIKPLYEKALELFNENNFSDCASQLEKASLIYSEDKPLQILQEKNLQMLIRDASADLDAKFALSQELDKE